MKAISMKTNQMLKLILFLIQATFVTKITKNQARIETYIVEIPVE